MNHNILVLIDYLKGSVAEISYEMLGIARKIADSSGGKVYALVAGKAAKTVATNLGAADEVFVIEDPECERLADDIIIEALKNLVQEKQVSLVFIGNTNISFGIGARLSARVKMPFVNWVREIKPVDGQLVVTSAQAGGKILCDIKLPDGKGIIGILSGSFPPDAGKIQKQPVITEIPKPEVKTGIRFKSLIEPKAGDIDITRMDVLVSVGRGIQTPDNIPLAEELANALGGAVSASRPVVDQGWLPLTRQVGKSGMTVSPKLYLALGISGAPEHYEGMKGSKLIVAINTDPKAPIFDFAHYGAVVDCLELIEPLKEEILKRKK
jgi:electron transfer flavoprotein alpha subunit